MFKTYFKIAWRNILRNRTHAVINIAGLAIGIAASLLIFVVIRYELSYDSFQKNYSRIYRVVTNTVHEDGSEDENPGIPTPAVEMLKNEFPQFEKVIAVNAGTGHQVTALGANPNTDVAASKKLIENDNIAFTQPDFFEMFSVRWIEGNGAALKNPENVVIDSSSAIKYFGTTSNVIGNYIKIDNAALFRISGVIADIPSNSDFPIKLFASYESFKNYPDLFGYSPEWGNLSSSHQVYVLMQENADLKKVETQLAEFSKKNYGRNGRSKRNQALQPLSDIHFNALYGSMGDHSISKSILWTLALIGMLIIIMASINFINLATAQAVGRSKEVGIKKVLGSTRAQLITQVMSETFLVVCVAMILAIAIALLALPALHHVASVPENISLFNIQTVLLMLALLVTVSFLSGFYPALVVSGFKPILALKSKINSASIGGISLRRALVVTQFGISQVLIIGTIIAITQMSFVRNADLGFDKEAVWLLPAYSDSLNLGRMRPLKQELLKNPDILSVSFASDEASSDNNWASNFAFNQKDNDEGYPVFHKYGDADYVKTFGLQLLAGRNYSESDTTKEYLINETLAKKLGINNPQDAIGKTIRVGGGQWFPVVGVVKDFKTNSLRDQVKPLTIAARKDFTYTMAVKTRTSNLNKTTQQVQRLWERSYPEFAFTSHFSEDTIEQFYRQETQLTLLYKVFAGIAIFISCLGLYGLVSYMAVQKTKEIGIRKVLGASIQSIIIMFSKEFTILIAVAFAIAAPAAWYLMNSWLQNFQYKIDIGIGVFALAIVTSLIIAWLTVGYRAFRAALINPVKSLKSE